MQPVSMSPSAVRPLTPQNYEFFQAYVWRESGILVEPDREYFLISRLQGLLDHFAFPSLNELCVRLQRPDGSDLRQRVIEAMTTNETLFFRDARPFEALKSQIVPKLVEQRAAVRRLSFWSAAASTGQEAYSLAMMLTDMGLGSWQVEITGTDLNEQVLSRARTGEYSQFEVNRGLPAPCLVRHFRKNADRWVLQEPVRRMVQFQRHDLRDPLRPAAPFDVVLCRNVLIYFDQPTKESILGHLRRSMKPDGYLILGSAETTLNLNVPFVREDVNGMLIYRPV